MKEVRNRRRRGRSTVTSQHQITIPVDALREAGLEAGDRLVARADGPGRIVFEREHDVLDAVAGSLPAVWEPGELDRLRDEWD